MNSRTWQAATALSLGISGSLLMWTGTKLPTWISRLSTLAIAAGVGYVAYKVHDSENLAGTDYLNASQAMWKMFEKEREQFGAVMVEFVPEPIRVADTTSDESWVGRSNKRFCLVCGRPEKGKTYLALLKMEQFIKNNASGYKIRLVDINYGKRKQTWGGFPTNAIIGAPFVNEKGERTVLEHDQKIKAAEEAIEEYYLELQRRVKDAALNPKEQEAFEPWFLILDECQSIVPRFEETTKEQLRSLIGEGPGYNFSGMFLSQDAAVNYMGLSESVKRQLDCIIVRPDDSAQLSEFMIRSDASPLVEKCLNAENSNTKLAVWKSQFGVGTYAIPDRTANPVQFTTPATATDGWLNRINRNMLAKALSEGATKTHLWNMVLEQTELSGKDSKQLRSNPYYSKFIELWNELTAEPQTVEIEAELEAA